MMAGQGSSAQAPRLPLRGPNPGLARYAAAAVYYRLRQADQDGTASPTRRCAPCSVAAAGGFAAQALPAAPWAWRN
ncbi:MAG: hypothetical protein WKG07_19405 [Hymenobacter sp.]